MQGPLGKPLDFSPVTDFTKPSAEQLTSVIRSIQPIPQITLKVIRMLNDDTCCMGDIAKEIRQDQVLAAKVIRLCNSSFFGLKTDAGSIDRALIMLGQKQFLQSETRHIKKTATNESNRRRGKIPAGLDIGVVPGA